MNLLLIILGLFYVQSLGVTVGILYEGWHGPAATAMRNIQQQGHPTLTVQQVVESNGQYQLNDILNKYNQQGVASNFYYQVEPELGFYCIYRKRNNESGTIPDCPNISTTLATHAKQLTSVGVDYIIVDATNLPTIDPFSDTIQLRPTEVIFEEWLALRQKGINTPKVAVWPTLPDGANMWQSFLNLYNNPAYEDLVMKDSATGKKIIFYVDNDQNSPSPSVLSQVMSNGGRNDIIAVGMWAIFNPVHYAQGRWSFMSPCTTNGQYSTNVNGLNCNQYVTTNSPLGSSVTVSASFQVGYGSIPFGAPGKLGGLTMRSLFNTAFRDQPAHIMVSSWNEWLAQPQPDPYRGVNIGFSMGLPNDPNRDYLFVDTYTHEFSRDIEPSKEYGNYSLELLGSCLRVLKSGARSCDNPAELCCQNPPEQNWNNIWSLRDIAINDHLLTNSEQEKNTLLQRGWAEICNPFGGPTLFCVQEQSNGQSGPFLLSSSQIAYTRPLYRCMDADNYHFFSLDPNCEGRKTESILGYISTVRAGATLRGLYRCYIKASNVHYHSLDIACPPSDQDYGLMGYVH